MNNEIKYKELDTIKISEKRNLVISECSAGGYTLAQQMVAEDGDFKVKVFLKNAIHVENKENLSKIKESIEKILENE